MSDSNEPVDDGDVSADAYDAAHDPVEDISELGLGEETILGGAEPPDAGQEYIDLSNPHQPEETREK